MRFTVPFSIGSHANLHTLMCAQTHADRCGSHVDFMALGYCPRLLVSQAGARYQNNFNTKVSVCCVWLCVCVCVCVCVCKLTWGQRRDFNSEKHFIHGFEGGKWFQHRRTSKPVLISSIINDWLGMAAGEEGSQTVGDLSVPAHTPTPTVCISGWNGGLHLPVAS